MVWGVSEPLYVVLNPNRRGSPLKKKFQSKSTKHLWLSQSISCYMKISQFVWLPLAISILEYLGLYQAISGYFRQTQAILVYLRLSLASYCNLLTDTPTSMNKSHWNFFNNIFRVDFLTIEFFDKLRQNRAKLRNYRASMIFIKSDLCKE